MISFEKLLFSWPDPKEMRYFHHFAFFVVVCKLFSFWFSFPKLLGEFKPSLMRMFIGWSSTKKSFNNIFSWSERHNRIKLANRPFAVFSSTNPKGQMSFLASLSIRLYIKVGKKKLFKVLVRISSWWVKKWMSGQFWFNF